MPKKEYILGIKLGQPLTRFTKKSILHFAKVQRYKDVENTF